MACGQTQGSPSSSKRQFPLSLLQHWRVSFRTLRACPGVSRGSVFAGYFVFVTSLLIGFLLRDELGICRVIQCNDRRFAKSLFPADDQTAVLQLTENPCSALSAAVQLLLRLFQCEVQADRAVRLNVSVLPGNAGSIQQQRIEHLRVVADVPQGFVLEKEPWKRHIGRRWALRRELAKSFHLTSYPIHPIRCIDWIDRLILLYLDLFLIS